MRIPKNPALTDAKNQTGFTLLEMVLSMGLAALMISAMMASLLQFNQHKLLAQALLQSQSQTQLAVAQVLADWFGVCGAGVISGTANTIGLMRNYQGGCIQYDYAHNTQNHNLTRRKLGGINSGFMAQVESMDLYFGVDSNNDCHIDQWRQSYQPSEFVELHQVRVNLQLRVRASKQLKAGEQSVWLWHENDNVIIHPVNFIWRLAHVCS